MKRERGFALVAALWLLVALSIAALELARSSRALRLGAANAVEAAQARAAAQGGLEHARARLAVLAARWQATGDPWSRLDSALLDTTRLGEARYAVRLRDASSALHLNQATEDELRRLFTALRVDAGEADRLAQAIMDWRDADDLHRGRGAERDHYERAGAAILPRNGPFRSEAELLAVRGMTRELYGQVRPFLTLLGTGQVNLHMADRPVLLALPGMGEQAVAVLQRFRRQGRRLANVADLGRELSGRAQREFEAALPSLLARTTLETREMEVRSVAWVERGRIRSEAEGLLVRSRGDVFFVWSRSE